MSLPLFPLNTVLFPGCNLDLQIFEARYLDMIGRCMKQGVGFGVVCILEGSEVGVAPEGFAMVGCEARITDFEQQDNGLLGIRVQGGRRFTVLRTEVQRDQLILAEVYAAGESVISAADGKALARAVRVAGKVEPVFVESMADMPTRICELAHDGDVVLSMGAGSIGGVPAQIKRLQGVGV